jgi:adenylyltransferase/sulfurtransferase
VRELSDAELDRYARHFVLHQIGGEGQRKLLDASVLVIGAGGLGSPCLLYLAAAGVGRIGIVDDDEVALSNLQRQILYGTEEIGRPKTLVASEVLHRLNPQIEIVTHATRVTSANAAELMRDYDLVADGCDNFETRFAVADAALSLRIPLVSAAIAQFEGQVATFAGWKPDLPCYRCFVPKAPSLTAGSCAEQGVLGVLPGIIGSFQALEVIRQIVGFGTSLAGRLLTFDAMTWDTQLLRLPKHGACDTCRAISLT